MTAKGGEPENRLAKDCKFGEHPLPLWPGSERSPRGAGVRTAASYEPGLEATVKNYTG